MGKRKTITSGRRPGRSRGDAQGGVRGDGEPKGRPLQSATPAPGVVPDGLMPKLKFRSLNAKPDNVEQHPDGKPGQSANGDDDFPQQLGPAPVTTRTGRRIHKPQQYDAMHGNDIDAFIDQSSEDRRDHVEDFMASDPSYVSHKAQEQVRKLPKPRGRPPKDFTSLNVGVGKVDEEDEESPSSQTLQAKSHPGDLSDFIADESVYTILNVLRSTNKIHLDLPGLSHASDPYRPQPYSAKILTQLYILCYQEKLWDMCDMICDTWIRAFHSQRKQSQLKPEDQIWRPNPALDRRKRKAQQAAMRGLSIPSEFDTNPKDYDIVVTDPELESDVTDVHTDLLNSLYDYTSPNCGARLLWADTLALGGDKTEKVIENLTKHRVELHPQLLFNIMQSSLRMCRRNLTLKIEESTEGAWCKRYHEHWRNKQPCYRERASTYRDDEEDMEEMGRGVEDETDDLIDLDLLDQFEAALMAQDEEAETFTGEKRSLEGGGETGPNKRAKYAGEDQDAEGDSEED